MEERIGFWARLWLAFVLPWKVLFDGRLAARIRGLDRAEIPGAEVQPTAQERELREGIREWDAEEAGITHAEPVADPTPALLLLAILQREGRLIDFLEEDAAAFSDAEIGAAARVVHEGCKRALADYLELEAVRAGEAEGDPVTLEPGFDAARTRVTGRVVGEPPFRGTLAHHGWRVKKVRLPELAPGHDATILAPAEVEVS